MSWSPPSSRRCFCLSRCLRPAAGPWHRLLQSHSPPTAQACPNARQAPAPDRDEMAYCCRPRRDDLDAIDPYALPYPESDWVPALAPPGTEAVHQVEVDGRAVRDHHVYLDGLLRDGACRSIEGRHGRKRRRLPTRPRSHSRCRRCPSPSHRNESGAAGKRRSSAAPLNRPGAGFPANKGHRQGKRPR